MEHLKIAFKNVSLLSFIMLIAYFGNLGCGNILTDKKLEMIKDSLSNKAEYFNPEYINKQIMLRCWLNFKSETIVNYTVVTYSTNNILQGFYEKDRKIISGKYSVKKDSKAYYLVMEFQEKELTATVMQIVGFNYTMVNEDIILPSEIIIAVDSTNHVILENWESTRQPVVQQHTQQPEQQTTTQQQPEQQTEEQPTTQNEKLYYNGCGYSYENKEDCMKQCGAFTDGETCIEGEATGKIIKASNTEAKSAIVYYKIQDTDGYTNLRNTPNGDIIRKVYPIEKFEIIGDENKFKKVKFEDGTTGYIHQSKIVVFE